jgi:hypothetical protein
VTAGKKQIRHHNNNNNNNNNIKAKSISSWHCNAGKNLPFGNPEDMH